MSKHAHRDPGVTYISVHKEESLIMFFFSAPEVNKYTHTHTYMSYLMLSNYSLVISAECLLPTESE